MQTRSREHHEIPVWLLQHFCTNGKLWIGFKKTGRILRKTPKEFYFRDNANTTVSYRKQGDGEMVRELSDEHEKILSTFDDRTSQAGKD